MDKFGGILTGGLMGDGMSSMILGQFRLFLFEVVVTTTTTTTTTTAPPGPTPGYPGRGGTGGGIDFKPFVPQGINIKVRIGSKTYEKSWAIEKESSMVARVVKMLAKRKRFKVSGTVESPAVKPVAVIRGDSNE